MDRFELQAQPQDTELRLDRLVARLCGISRSIAQQLLEEGHVLVNGEKAAKSQKLALGDTLSVCVPPPRETEVLPEDIPLDVFYEDGHLLVVNKPKGMVVHPAAGNTEGTLVNALLHHCAGSLSGIGGEIRPGIVHRIDKDTSGLLVVAKDDKTHQGLAQQFARHSAQRVYQAVVYGRFKELGGEIDQPIGRSTADRKKMAVTDKHSKEAVTTYRVLAQYQGFSWLALRLKTGRTHQIRVHMANAGHPLAGDAVYGPKKVITKLHGQCLHAGTLGFTHPITGEQLLFESDLPPYFTSFLVSLGEEDFAQMRNGGASLE
ncbi:RluA family pseudouridine synthase [Clostridia bacterium OttesenSCG-928-O13]|nr:RluA family pseudouridine synthase [Clostridia bacterium OttesenSCG-928-O13]